MPPRRQYRTPNATQGMTLSLPPFTRGVIWLLGSFLESAWGTKRFLIFYLTCAAAGGLGSVALTYALRASGDANLFFTGANGAILGLLVAIGVLWADVE